MSRAGGGSVRRQREVRGWLFVAPYLAYVATFFLFPMVWSLLLAWTDWNLISPVKQWVGLENFIKAVQSPQVHAAFVNTYRLMAVFVPVALAWSLGLALLLDRMPRGSAFFSVGYFLPYLASGVAVALVVRGIVAYNSPVNAALRQRLNLDIAWLQDPILALVIIALLIAWKFSGYFGLILLAGLRGISRDLYDAAALDGATGWKRFRFVTLPMLYPAVSSVLILAIALTFGVFTEPYILTKGGPDLATHTWHLEIYNQAFTSFRAGFASAVAVLSALATFATIGLVRLALQRWGNRYDPA